jgi:hypothetical protein
VLRVCRVDQRCHSCCAKDRPDEKQTGKDGEGDLKEEAVGGPRRFPPLGPGCFLSLPTDRQSSPWSTVLVVQVYPNYRLSNQDSATAVGFHGAVARNTCTLTIPSIPLHPCFSRSSVQIWRYCVCTLETGHRRLASASRSPLVRCGCDSADKPIVMQPRVDGFSRRGCTTFENPVTGGRMWQTPHVSDTVCRSRSWLILAQPPPPSPLVKLPVQQHS